MRHESLSLVRGSFRWGRSCGRPLQRHASTVSSSDRRTWHAAVPAGHSWISARCGGAGWVPTKCVEILGILSETETTRRQYSVV